MASPVCFVRPTADMMVKPGHPHVTSDGYVTIPYTVDWRPDCTLIELVAHMCSIFGNMPPVFRRPSNSNPLPYQNRVNESGSSGSTGASGTGGYFQQGSYAQTHPPQPSPYYSPQFQTYPRQEVSVSEDFRDSESLFGESQQFPEEGSTLSSGSVMVIPGEVRREDCASALRVEITGKIQMQLEKIFKRVRDDIDLQFEHEIQLTQSRENVEQGLQSLRFLRDDIARAQEIVEMQDNETTAWLEENEHKETVDPDTILVESDALSKQYVTFLRVVTTTQLKPFDALMFAQNDQDAGRAQFYRGRALLHGPCFRQRRDRTVGVFKGSTKTLSEAIHVSGARTKNTRQAARARGVLVP